MDKNIFSPLLGFKEQFSFNPIIANKQILPTYSQVVICGMGGSAIAVSILKLLFPSLKIKLHNTYGLPVDYDKSNTLIILNSYSGNTEEVLESFERAKKDGCNIAAISTGGSLINNIKELGGTFIELPQTSLEPRFSIGYQMISILSILEEDKKISLLREKVALIDLETISSLSKNIADQFSNKYPILYTSINLSAVAYLIKTVINEGAKTPSFINLIPEANHNELQSFVINDEKSESSHFCFWYMVSPFDHIRIQKRFTVMQQLHQEKKFSVHRSDTDHTDITSLFELILTGYFTATYMAVTKNIDPYGTPFITEFKKRLTE